MIYINGLTGLLRPNGVFLECSYGNHCVIAETIPIEEEMNCIYFSSNENVESSLLFFCDNPTKKQYQFIIQNLDKLDTTQYNLWIKYIKE